MTEKFKCDIRWEVSRGFLKKASLLKKIQKREEWRKESKGKNEQESYYYLFKSRRRKKKKKKISSRPHAEK